jgi:ribosomal protein S20
VPRNTLSTWLKNIVNAFKSGNNRSTQKLKSSNYENLDKAVYKWFVKVRDEGYP